MQGGSAIEVAPAPRGAVPAIACLLALMSGALALYLWRQLAVADAGGEVTCPFDAAGDCAAVWQSGLAKSVEAATGLPIAAHGVLWSLVALALAAATLVARSRGGRGEISWAGACATAVAGVVAVVALAAAQLVEGRFCGSCGIAYALVLAYAGVCWFAGERIPRERLLRGGAVAAGAAVLAFAALALTAPERPSAGLASSDAHPPAAAQLLPTTERAAASLSRFLASLSPTAAEALAADLRSYATRPAEDLGEPRALLGSPMAPVRITDFADFLCSHCAELHGTLAQLRQIAPEGSFAVDSHYFPLDGRCNPQIERASEDGVGCVAARALICLEGDPRAFEVAGQLYARHRSLTVDQIYELAAPLRSREALEACAASEETSAKLQSDIATALRHQIRGTPLVLVNGRQASSRPATLFALVLSGGDPAHPAFAVLPKPKGG